MLKDNIKFKFDKLSKYIDYIEYHYPKFYKEYMMNISLDDYLNKELTTKIIYNLVENECGHNIYFKSKDEICEKQSYKFKTLLLVLYIFLHNKEIIFKQTLFDLFREAYRVEEDSTSISGLNEFVHGEVISYLASITNLTRRYFAHYKVLYEECGLRTLPVIAFAKKCYNLTFPKCKPSHFIKLFDWQKNHLIAFNYDKIIHDYIVIKDINNVQRNDLEQYIKIDKLDLAIKHEDLSNVTFIKTVNRFVDEEGINNLTVYAYHKSEELIIPKIKLNYCIDTALITEDFPFIKNTREDDLKKIVVHLFITKEYNSILKIIKKHIKNNILEINHHFDGNSFFFSETKSLDLIINPKTPKCNFIKLRNKQYINTTLETKNTFSVYNKEDKGIEKSILCHLISITYK